MKADLTIEEHRFIRHQIHINKKLKRKNGFVLSRYKQSARGAVESAASQSESPVCHVSWACRDGVQTRSRRTAMPWPPPMHAEPIAY